MSCVIGLVTRKEDVILVADTSASDGNVLIPNLYDKVVLRSINLGTGDSIDIVIGACGPTQAGIAIRQFLKLPLLESVEEIPAYMETLFLAALREAIEETGLDYFDRDSGGAGEFLVGVRGRLYFVDHTLGIASSGRGYEAIGSARDIALGSLHTSRITSAELGGTARVRMAMDAADDLTAHVKGSPMFITAEYGVKSS